MKHFYISNPNAEKGFDEVSEQEFYALLGDEKTRPYASKVYKNEMTLEEVPEDIRENVETVVKNRIARWGTYESTDIPDSEALNIITGGN